LKLRSAISILSAAFVLSIAMGGPAFAASVSAEDFVFVPKTVTINVGDSITWTNNGTSLHTATADDSSFDSGTLNAGDTFTHTFNTPGTIPYHCEFHQGQGMVGTIVVNAASTTTPPGGTSGREPLPNTGASSSTGPFIWLGLSLLVAGGGVLLALRLRRARA
jgi:LPXTG-motif cell wall-anchored protein